ncbi:metallophosphoesterase [Virgisporangium aurantiacum]|uniref:Membrane protein n=1 Tax=Virgisporangium aurantiacum TaxID=175570 RepID=A0A8J3Z978_9ACTN|nr:metallophosphoesterase [Virgisporangium aurantiacum]GIJ59716.1 membrane protein [Virgisporangium aurantiacum]
MIAVFLVVVFGVLFGIHFYLWKRLVKDTTTRGRARLLGTLGMVAMVLLIVSGLTFGRLARPDAARWIAWPAYLWLATMFYLLVILAVLEIPRLVLRFTWVRRAQVAEEPVPVEEPALVPATESAASAPPAGASTAPPTEPSTGPPAAGSPAAGSPAAGSPAAGRPARAADPGRRLLLARGMAIAAGATSVATVGYGVSQAMGGPRLDRVTIPLAKLPRQLDGLRIALVSDIHLGPLLGRSHTRRIVDMINGVGADLVAVVGDLVDGSVAELGPAAEPLADLESKHGSFFVTGNHEYFSGYAEWIDEVDSLGLRVLQNERVEIEGLDLAGVNDVTGGSYRHAPDFDKALGDRDPARPVVLLAHQPIQVTEAAKHGVDLQLSGHTHGGQIQPFGALVRLEQPVVSGLDTVDGTKIYVTNGAGFWGPPVRVGAPPQVSVVELRAIQ